MWIKPVYSFCRGQGEQAGQIREKYKGHNIYWITWIKHIYVKYHDKHACFTTMQCKIANIKCKRVENSR